MNIRNSVVVMVERLATRCRPVLLALVIAGVAGCAQSHLMDALDERQANEVIAALLRQNIGAEKVPLGKGKFAVTVAKADMASAVELLQRDDLPSAPRTQVADAFPSDALVSTPLGEHARLISAIEQRLEESLVLIDGVRSARVHVSYGAKPGEKVTSGVASGVHIAAIVSHLPGVNEDVLLQSTKRFLKNTFDEVDYENVSVILSPRPGPHVMSVTEGRAGEEGWIQQVGTWVVGLLAAAMGVALLMVLLKDKAPANDIVQRTRRRITALRGGEAETPHAS